MNDFYRTPMGRKYYESDLPRLIEALEKIGKHMQDSNRLEEKKFKLEEKLNKLKIKKINESLKSDSSLK